MIFHDYVPSAVTYYCVLLPRPTHYVRSKKRHDLCCGAQNWIFMAVPVNGVLECCDMLPKRVTLGVSEWGFRKERLEMGF